MAAFFECVTGYEDSRIPVRKTANSAGYDFFAAEDIIIPAYEDLCNEIIGKHLENYDSVLDAITDKQNCIGALTLDEMAALTKAAKAKPTLIPTGIKCHLDPDTFLQLSIRSSSPLKYWITLANGVGIIDADYYNNPDNEGHIYFQVINLSPIPIKIKKGDAIGQGVIMNYFTVQDDCAIETRVGGFGSTDSALASAM